MNGLFVHGSNDINFVFTKTCKEEVEHILNIKDKAYDLSKFPEGAEVLKEVEVIISVWGTPRFTNEFMDACENLKLVIHVGGSAKGQTNQRMWERDIMLTSTYAANAVPVAEYTVSQIICCLKKGLEFARYIYMEKHYPPKAREMITGAFGSTVGLISLGMIGKHVCEILKHFDVKIIAYDPFLSRENAATLNVELCSLEDVFKNSDVVSLHTPWLKETEGMITGHHFESMKANSSFINTSRGAVVNENEMVEVLKIRKDIQVVLDVTHPEPPIQGSPLYTLRNVFITPHVAGAAGNEPKRMGEYALAELKRYIKGEPLKYRILEEMVAYLA